MEYKQCSRCLLDTTVSTIRFDIHGVCNFCKSHDLLSLEYQDTKVNEVRLNYLVESIKKKGKGKDFDCIVGLSGGTDSSYTLHITKKIGLRPLAVHFDNGWNTDQSVSNVKKITEKLNVDLETYVVDWEEFKDIQISFLNASTPCIEAPTDVAIHSVLFRTASKEKIKYILGGQSFKTEGTVPREWSYLDGTYIKNVHSKFGKIKISSFPNLSLLEIAYFTFLKAIRNIPFLNYFDYDKKVAKDLLSKEYGWVDYSGHHYENIYSKFAFGYYLPKKFGIDKRKVSLSGPVRSGLMSKKEALNILSTPPPVEESIVEYTYQKLGLTKDEYQSYFSLPSKTYKNYYTSENIIKYFKIPIFFAVKMGFFTPVLYEKYFK
jgi:N-acetyl sugar amidotransferase